MPRDQHKNNNSKTMNTVLFGLNDMNVNNDFSANLTRYKRHRMTFNKAIYSAPETEFEMMYVVVSEA